MVLWELKTYPFSVVILDLFIFTSSTFHVICNRKQIKTSLKKRCAETVCYSRNLKNQPLPSVLKQISVNSLLQSLSVLRSATMPKSDDEKSTLAIAVNLFVCLFEAWCTLILRLQLQTDGSYSLSQIRTTIRYLLTVLNTTKGAALHAVHQSPKKCSKYFSKSLSSALHNFRSSKSQVRSNSENRSTYELR